MKEQQILLKKYFGYDTFRTGQDKIIEQILSGRDCLAIMPTGAGKSICYQIPSMIFSGITIVISPLISLMKDQVDSLNEIGIPATFINSTLTDAEYSQTMQNISYNIYKIIYVTPERFCLESFTNFLNTLNISMITIDEAHCISQWGHDFRPTYREIHNVISKLKKRPILSAFTATATNIVKQDIIDLLHLSNPFVLITGFNRPNLSFAVETPKSKKDYIINFLNENKEIPGIIYCSTRKQVDNLYDELTSENFNVSKYHAGMSEQARNKAQEDFSYDKTTTMIATCAFGMGIDKSNIRYVIHYTMPKDLESYYQETGRAGRDGDTAKCILLFNRSDIVTNKFLIEQNDNFVEYDKLNDIIDYCSTDKCLRKYILEYFGETPDFENCNNCSNCLSTIETTDVTIDAQKILSCIQRMRRHFGASFVASILKGSSSERIKNLQFDELPTYGIMKEYPKKTITDLIYFLISEGYIRTVGYKFPVLMLSPLADEVLFHDRKVLIKKKFEKTETQQKQSSNNQNLDYNVKLFELLRALRKQISLKNNIPPFIVFNDISLKEMATFYPTTTENLLKINGVGLKKIEKYGDIFINTIQKYISENDIKLA